MIAINTLKLPAQGFDANGVIVKDVPNFAPGEPLGVRYDPSGFIEFDTLVTENTATDVQDCKFYVVKRGKSVPLDRDSTGPSVGGCQVGKDYVYVLASCYSRAST